MIIPMPSMRTTAEQLKMAEILAANEINDTLADLEIIEEALANTYLFKDFKIRELAIKHLAEFKQNPENTSFSKEVLSEVYRHYFPSAS